ncbi:cytochrome c [uncultured Rhodoblastus sp.]|uniref:c-type cytochrome n=1 Tax=uncultured Rhodoblastus sp. TaxID=543037 RepID=UPI0025D59F24|nr:cytochrome c [uncultured Rhodoblastus sp.]
MDRVKSCAFALSAVFFSLTASAASAAPDAALVARGENLARAGDCVACHTTPGRAPYAGGEAINTPFGPIYPPNITPNKLHGIGAWSDDEFYRAMHEGIGKHGEYLYPAFPYQWFTKVSREDVDAIRAYLQTVRPSSTPSKPTRLMFPFNIREGIRAWNDLYFRPGAFAPDASKSEEWNRGAYLVEGLGHCGDCHTPKGLAMQPVTSKAFSGGEIDDWYAPNITSDKRRGIGRWTEAELAQILKTGAAPGKGVLVGPMAQVVHDSLSHLSDADLHAIAVYLKTIPAISDYKADRPTGEIGPHASGESVYLEYCVSCHQINGQGIKGAVPALAGNDLVRAKGPEDVIRVILGGRLATGTYAPMPAPGAYMTDQQVADVTDYVRNAWSNAAPVIEKTGLVGDIRGQTVSTISGPGAIEEANDPCKTSEDAPPVPPIDDPGIVKALSAMTAETMLPKLPSLVARARDVAPKLSQADIVNGLTLAYCKTLAHKASFRQPHGRDLLNRFSWLVYSEIVSNGHE